MGGRPLTDADYDRLADALNRFHGDRAMNLEQLDGLFAALICGPDLVRPSEYLPEIWGGGGMADEEAFSKVGRLSGISCVGGHDGWKGAQPCRDAKRLIFLMPSWTSCWLGPIRRRPLIRTAFSTA